MLSNQEQNSSETDALLPHLQRLPDGYCQRLYRGVRYGISKTRFNGGRSFKVFARALDGSDFVSLNLYLTASGEHLKPCEMPAAKVVDFLRHLQHLPDSQSAGTEPNL